MRCPKCGKELLCGCNSCYKRSIKKVDRDNTLLVWKTDESQVCVSCGLHHHCDYWTTLEYNQLKKSQIKH